MVTQVLNCKTKLIILNKKDKNIFIKIIILISFYDVNKYSLNQRIGI